MKKAWLTKKILIALCLGTIYHAPIVHAADDTITNINTTATNNSSYVYGYQVNTGISTIDIIHGCITADVNNSPLTSVAYTSAAVVGFYNDSHTAILQGSTGEIFPIAVSATGGNASGSGYANAYGDAAAISLKNSSTILLSTDTALTATAIGGTVSSSFNSAGAKAHGISSCNSTATLGGNTTITATASGGTATATSTAASSFADAQTAAMGLYYFDTMPNSTTINGSMTIALKSDGGKASSYADVAAPAYAYGIYYYGTGTNSTTIGANAAITGAANGGTALSSSGNADAHADAQGITAGYNNPTNSTSIGGDTTILLAASGGYASSPVSANAGAQTYGISGDHSTISLGGNMAITMTANGGHANSASSANASAGVFGIYADNSTTAISGNANILAAANGGTASSSNTGFADASAYGIVTTNSTTTIGGNTTITAAATGGNAASSTASATGVVMDNSTVTLNGDAVITAIAAGGNSPPDVSATGITAQNNSAITLHGNTTITAAASTKSSYAAACSLLADNSTITINQTANSPYTVKLIGDVAAQNGAAINLALTDKDSFLLGNIETKSATVNLTVANSAAWTTSGSSRLTNLTMNNGRVVLGSNLNIAGNLAGSGGTFYLNGGAANCIVVDGAASGNYQLVINNTSGTLAGKTLAKIVDLNDSMPNTATFTAEQNALDSRAYHYQFAQGAAISGLNSNDYYYYASGPSNLSSAAIADSAETVVAWYGEMNEIKKRLGDLRMGTQPNSDVWARTYAGKYNIKPNGSNSYSQLMRGVEVGKDNPQSYHGGTKYTGVLLGFGQADNTYGGGGSGTTNSGYMGTYVSWLHDDGTYIDLIGKYNHLRHSFTTPVSSSTSTDSGLFSNRALGVSVEIGKHIKRAGGVFIEPQLELASLWSNSASYTSAQGLAIDVPAVHSLQLRLGCAAGRNWTDRDGANRQLYGKVSWVNEYAGNSRTIVDNVAFDSSLKGQQWVTGLGFIEDTKNYQFYLDIEKSWGSATSKQWGVNMGYRWKL